MPRPTFDIFISSTSEDLQECRQKIHEVIIRYSYSPVQMELFGPSPQQPLDECRKRVERCDLLIVIVANRYGWIPTTEQGGDGEKSITWLEVEWARERNIPVYAFLLEADGNLSNINKVSQENSESLNHLQSFKEYLKGELTVAFFISPSDLAVKVATGLPEWILNTVTNQDIISYYSAPEQNNEIDFNSVDRNIILFDIQRNQEEIDRILLSINIKNQKDRELPWQVRAIKQITEWQPELNELVGNYGYYHTLLYTELLTIEEVSTETLIKLKAYGDNIYRKLYPFSIQASSQI